MNTHQHSATSSSRLSALPPLEHQWLFSEGRLSYPAANSHVGPGSYHPRSSNSLQFAWSKAPRFITSHASETPHTLSNNTIFNLSHQRNNPKLTKSSQQHLRTDLNTNPPQKVRIRRMSNPPKSYLTQAQPALLSPLLTPQRHIQLGLTPQEDSSSPLNDAALQPQTASTHTFLNRLLSSSQSHATVSDVQCPQTLPSAFPRPSAVFSSKLTRACSQLERSLDTIGPGSYNISQSLIHSKHQSKSRLFPILSPSKAHKKAPPQNKPDANPEQPGPGSYDVGRSVSSHNSQRGVKIPHGKRFSEPQDSLPGPGHYMRQKFLFVNEKLWREASNPHIRRITKPDASRLSNQSSQRCLRQSSLRTPEGQDTKGVWKNGTPFGKYDLNYFNITFKLRKQQAHLERLKFLDVELPAFSSKKTRFK